MSKPIVFFSHSSRDGGALRRLKQRFIDLTGSTIDVFLSSDGQSIRLGQNWLASIEQALADATLMFVFVSPTAVKSPWIYFEAGHAYAKRLDVVPVGLFGIEVGSIPPPLSILQGFNVSGHESLNNIIAKTNEKFSYSHKLGFLPEDYAALQSQNSFAASRLLGKHVGAIEYIEVAARNVVLDQDGFLDSVRTLEQPKLIRGTTCAIPGASISWRMSSAKDGKVSNRLHCEIEPTLAHVALPIVEELIQRSLANERSGETLAYRMAIGMQSALVWDTRSHIVMARLHGSSASLEFDSKQARFKHGDLYFTIDHFPDRPMLSLKCSAKSFASCDIGSLLDLLFESGVVRYSDLKTYDRT